ncbi:hypothetical protein PPS11_21589 [Pseudomonas putida S11]|nr:hypothetical protein PPS11_21589 [Pseudomonas putida S11]
MRVAGQQRPAATSAAAGHGPGVAALELRDARIAQRVMAEAGEGLQALPVGSGQRCTQGALGLPGEIEDVQVLRAQLVADIG